MAIRIKLLPCFGSSKRPKTELIIETVLSRNPLWPNTQFMEHKSNGEAVVMRDSQRLCQEMEISLCGPRGKLEYTSNHPENPSPLTLAAFRPGWDDYLDLTETVAEISQCLINEDGQLEGMMAKEGAVLEKKDTALIVALPPNDDVKFVSKSEFPGSHHGLEASATTTCPEGMEPIDEAALLGHFSDTLSEMAASLLDLEDGYFKALHEVIIETKRALWDISHIDAHYISQVVTMMSSWQEAVQTATTHMENTDLTVYLMHWEDTQKARKEYVATVIRAHEERDAAHAKEAEVQKQAIKTGDPEDPVVHLLEVTRRAVCTQAVRAVDAFLSKIKETLRKHVPVTAQGPLIANAMSTACQFQMSVWQMVGEECIRPLWAKHSDWCGMAGVVQAIVETFPNNCAIMFPQAPSSIEAFSATFRPGLIRGRGRR